MPHLRLLSALLWLLLAAISAQAQNPPPVRPAARPQARPAEPPANCLVTEFRAMALGTHELKERAAKASEWLRRHASACSDDQLRLIYANRSNWLGNAESIELTSQIEGALENRLKNKPEQLAQLFGAPPRPAPAASETLRAGDLAPRPAPVVAPGTPAVAKNTAVVVPPGAAPAGGAGPRPPGGPGAAPTPPDKKPEPGKFFEPALRKAVQDYFTANRGDGPCPPGVVIKRGRCESPTANRSWKIGQALPASASPKELPARLLEALGAVPKGHNYALVDGDILLIADEGKTVIDAVLDLGQVAPRR
jgi:hypothetical protein